MQCMKCGREIQAGDVFCPECLSEMEQYPVKPGTPVHIPKQPEKKLHDRRAAVTPERRIEILTRRVRVLSWILTLAAALLIAACALMFSLLQDGDEGFAIGQNYSSAGQLEETSNTD